jgi:hypothetical protein
MGGLQRGSGIFKEEENILAVQGFEHGIVQLLA